MKRLRKLWESVVYMGMQPGADPQRRISRLFGPFRGPVERFIAGGVAPSDPLYLSNRTLGQKIRFSIVVAIPCVLVLGLLAIGAGNYFHVQEKPVRELTIAELREKILPNLAKNIRIETHDLEVVEARVEPGHVLGTVRNIANHPIEDATLVFDLTDGVGTRLGAVSAKIAHVDANSTAAFHIDIDQPNAGFALVREVVVGR